MQIEGWVIEGDCLEALAKLPAASVDAVVTDPPYGLSFMGHGWDRGVPGSVYWEAVQRIAKPGAWLVAFGGTRTHHRLWCAIEDAGWEIRDTVLWMYGQGMPKSLNVGKALEGTPEAEEWEGWGTGLKPAWEPICLARAPLVGTVSANVLEHGTGALNIEACRISAQGRPLRVTTDKTKRKTKLFSSLKNGSMAVGETDLGRWPANVCLDEVAAAALDQQAPSCGAAAPVLGTEPSKPTRNAYGEYKRSGGEFYGDTGGASRFFYCSKAKREDRGPGNDHPTVKPIDLMRWLVRLIARRGSLVLDPFCGSGSTGVAAIAEGCHFVGIEIDPTYAEIARLRVGEASQQGQLPFV